MKRIVSGGLMKNVVLCSSLAFITVLCIFLQPVWACSRVVYETGTGSYITGRSMDWNDPTAKTSLWVFPRGMERDGGGGEKSIKWISKYGSVVASFYDIATADGMNEAGLVGNTLYLAETDYGDASKTGKPTIKIGAWLQYYLDNFATVKEAVAAMQPLPFTIVAPTLPNGREATVHVSLSDASGDSAIFEFLGGKLVIHHGTGFKVMTNSPTYDRQLALNAYWDQIGGNRFLPGTISAADRFVRLSYDLKSSPKYKDPKLALASVFSLMRAISVPLGMEDPNLPNISMTLWRTVADHGKMVFYFDAATMPAIFWVDFKNVDFKQGAGSKEIKITPETEFAGEVSSRFAPAKPFQW